MGLWFLLCRWQVFFGSVLVYRVSASVCQKRCCWLVILQHWCHFSSIPICYWCPPIPFDGHFFSWDVEEFVHWGSVSWSNRVCAVVMLISVDFMCPAISGALVPFFFLGGLLKCGQFSGRSRKLHPRSNYNPASACRHIKNMVFRFFSRPEFPLSMRLTFGCVSVVVLEYAAMSWILLSALSIVRAMRLA